MQYSFVEGVRLLPTPKASGACPACAQPTIAKCGQQVVWHWAHARPKHCDKWWESETQWHLDWKARFPEEWREVVQVDSSSGERHIADIKTPRGVVIELQNSPMPPAELKARETFYQRMIWIVNAQSFAKSFHLGDALPDPKRVSLEDLFGGQRDAVVRDALWQGKPWIKTQAHLELERLERFKDRMAQLYVEHHRFQWVRPRKVWLKATCPVFLDFGGNDLLRLCEHPFVYGCCARLVSRQDLIRKNGGDPGPDP